MGFLTVKNVKVSGVSSVVPLTVVKNIDLPLFETKEEAQKFIDVTGIEEKRHASKTICTSDLCYEASKKLLSKLEWDVNDVDVLIFVSQTPDYIVPNTSIILQDRLGIPKNSICFDVPLGCSGYVYGLSILGKLLQDGQLKKGLLLVGDTLTKQCSVKDKVTYPLFGDAGTATALEFCEAEEINFSLWSNGAGYKSIIIPEGGYRCPLTEKSIQEYTDEKGNTRTPVQTHMNGADVFSFGITTVPKEMKSFMENYKLDDNEINHYFFHQANMFMNNMIRKKLGIDKSKVPYSLHKYGNTSSATIPLTINTISDIQDSVGVLCGFGVGLSIGIAKVKFHKDFINLLNYYK